jgi:hypothetical protein
MDERNLQSQAEGWEGTVALGNHKKQQKQHSFVSTSLKAWTTMLI